MCNRFTKNRGKFNIYSKNRGKTASRRGTRGKGVKPGLAPPKPGRLVSLVNLIYALKNQKKNMIFDWWKHHARMKISQFISLGNKAYTFMNILIPHL